jgi:LmbE family N-acetylglucosaminyl deacetylase
MTRSSTSRIAAPVRRILAAAAVAATTLTCVSSTALGLPAAAAPTNPVASATRPASMARPVSTARPASMARPLSTARPAPAARPASTAARPPRCAPVMNVVAHEDDDLLFINPAIGDDIAAHRCVTTVFVTAGDAGRGFAFWRGRERGAMAAYAQMARTGTGWTEDTPEIGGVGVHRARLKGTRVTLLFMRIPDKYGAPFHARLRAIWQGTGTSRTIRTVDGRQVYTRASIVGAVRAMMGLYRPRQIRTLDYTHLFNDGDHEDHHVAGMIAEEAQRGYAVAHDLVAYQGYDIRFLSPGRLAAGQTDAKYAAFHAYGSGDRRVCQTLDACRANADYWGYLTNQVVLDVRRRKG